MLITALRQAHFSLENFSGPLEFLHQLIQRHELDICEIPLQSIAMQFLHHLASWGKTDVNAGAEFIGTLASMALVKSRLLLPQQVGVSEEAESEAEAGLELLQKLIDYCRLKESAQDLLVREQSQWGVYPRGAEPKVEVEVASKLGIEHLTLQELQSLLIRAIRHSDGNPPPIREETWKLSDKIRALRDQLSQHAKLRVADLFRLEQPRKELIVTFLAILELMKTGGATLMKEETDGQLVICAC